MTATLNERAIRLREVMERVGMSRAWIYDQISAGRFPRPIKLGERASAWLETEVTAFLESRAALRAKRASGVGASL